MRRATAALLSVLAAAAVTSALAATATAATRSPRLTGVRCVPATASACRTSVQLPIGRQLQLRGVRLKAGQRVTFRWPRGAIATTLRRGGAGWVVRVPPGVRAGTVSVTVRDRAGRRSNIVRIRVLVPTPSAPTPTISAPGELPQAFRGTGLWIWELPKSDGGSLDRIAARAAASGATTVFVKAADGTTTWDQFSPLTVAGLKARGLRVCGWQFVYGNDPAGEARAAAAAIDVGADCFVIDAETRYEGRYAAAQRYIGALRAAVTPAYPIGLTSFPYVDYHPKLPYSVFLGPGGAQANLPQVYWKAIGSSVDAVSAHTLAHNRIYGAPIAPLGQAYGTPAPADVLRFRQVWAAYGAAGLSWWSYQAADSGTWAALAQPTPAPAVLSDPGWPALGQGSKGDEVVWLQQHLASSTPGLPITGTFDAATGAALGALQSAHGLPATRTTDPPTWAAVLSLPLTPKDWTAAGS